MRPPAITFFPQHFAPSGGGFAGMPDRIGVGADEPARWPIHPARSCEHRHDVPPACEHLLCELIGGSCSLATGRSRGCRPGLASRTVAPEVFDEVRTLLAVIDPQIRDDRVRAAAVRLAEIFRREAREDRNLLALVRTDDPDLAPALAQLCVRRR
jgi:hypothetical protein